jgi:hypothetical protein
MPRGGRRRGTPNKAYGNRTDLNAPKPNPVTFSGQPYGMGKQQADAQAATPPGAPAAAPAGPPGPGGATPGPPGTPPGGLGAFNRPTERPGEPITQGLSSGAGAGPEVLGLQDPGGDPITLQLRALYQRFPIQEIADLLDEGAQGRI